MSGRATPEGPDREGAVLRPGGDAGATVPGASTLGMAIFLASLTMLFGGSLVGYLVVRARADVWPPPDAPPLPAGLWLSTAILVASSATAHLAVVAARRGRPQRMLAGLLATAALGVAFLMIQGFNWVELVAEKAGPGKDLYGFTFFMLTGLHAAHVLGGLAGLAVVLIRAFLGKYTWASYGGVRNIATYWHFLDVVWIALFAVLLFAG